MFPFQHILCPTDFSEASRCGLKMASEMAEKFGSKILVLYVNKPLQPLPSPQIETADVSFDTAAYEDQLSREARAQLEALSGDIFPADTEPRLEVRIGHPAEEIVKVSEEEDCDAIFMATHGRTGLKHIVFGSVAERVVSRANCPVLTVRHCD